MNRLTRRTRGKIALVIDDSARESSAKNNRYWSSNNAIPETYPYIRRATNWNRSASADTIGANNKITTIERRYAWDSG